MVSKEDFSLVIALRDADIFKTIFLNKNECNC